VLRGTVADKIAVSSVTAQVGLAAPITANISDQNWEATIANMALGDNTIAITARDAAGNSVTKTTMITRLSAGAANSDGNITIDDALMSLKFVVGLATPTPEQVIRSDVAPIDMTTHQSKPDGKLDIDDVLVMIRRAVGLPW
jgi:hypothetical protein